MKTLKTYGKVFPVLVSYLFILLFVYAAVSKLLDFDTFETQLGQSSLLSAYGSTVSVNVIIIELIASGLLMFHKTRLIGLYLSFFLMLMFTIYIVIILYFSPYIPCSCGGVLEALGWKEHLIFNSFFIGIAIVGVLIERKQKHNFN